jgi:hypothetical protein
MAITKEIISDKIEIIGKFKAVQCREVTVIKEDGVEIGRSYHRHVLHPSDCKENGAINSDGDFVVDGTYTHTDTDISGEPQPTQDVCAAVWTDAVKAAWKTHMESISS